jgi:hypothetical protein
MLPPNIDSHLQRIVPLCSVHTMHQCSGKDLARTARQYTCGWLAGAASHACSECKGILLSIILTSLCQAMLVFAAA